MNKEEYRQLLLRPEWKRKRSKILLRDQNCCTKCGKRGTEVHHLWYPPGKAPWEIADKYLTTLCRSCHEKEHQEKSLSEFFKTPKGENKTVKNKTVKKRTEKKKKAKQKRIKVKMNKEMKKLQARYDKLFSEGKITR